MLSVSTHTILSDSETVCEALQLQQQMQELKANIDKLQTSSAADTSGRVGNIHCIYIQREEKQQHAAAHFWLAAGCKAQSCQDER